ncbi:MAG: hypothetical protein VKK42_29630 [Lyngbya sp.]|nr:hypothetical protein [Lyngbya sp.]
MEEEKGVKAANHTVHQTVRYKLEAKLKTPRPSSTNKNKQGEESFKKT